VNNMKDPIPQDILKILVCPLDKGDLTYNSKKTALVCTVCNKSYPITDGIADMRINQN